MTTLAQLQMRAFLRRWPLSVLAGLALLGVAAAGAYELYLAKLPNAVVLDALSNFTRYSIVLPLVVAVLTFELVSTPRLVGMEEAVDAHPETAHRHFLAMMVPPTALVATIFLVYSAFKFAVIFAAGLTEVLAVHLFAQAILDVLAPCVIGMLLGGLAARRLGRYSGYVALVLFAFLIGPYMEVVPMLAQAGIASGGNGANLYPAYDLFRVLAPDPTWSMDALYGFPLEITRWALAGFWILGLLALLLPAMTNSGAKAARFARVLVAALAALCLVIALMPSSVLRRDYRFLGGSSIVSEQIYYQIQREQHPKREISADFKIDRYDMRLTAGRQLSATAVLDISGHSNDAPYRFTLYHGYHVDGVYGVGNEPLNFTQDGDYVTVIKPGRLRQITFKYHGSGGIYIANRQGVMLPGYFPYYPVPGFVRVWDDLRLAPVANVSGNGPAQFSVRFDAHVPLASNLRLRDGLFEGRTTAPSFVGGLLKQTAVAGHPVVYYPASGVDPATLPGLITRLRDDERSLGLTESPLSDGASVIQMPGLTQGETTVLPDTIFLPGIDQSLAVDVLVAGLPARLERENLKQAFTRVLGDPHGLDGLSGVRPTDDELAKLERARLSARSDTERVQVYHNPAKAAVFWLFREKVREQGLWNALRDTYRYLASDSTMSELQFLTHQGDTEAQ